MSGTDLKTEAFVLRRTNYGETDRILNLLTPEGKISCLAKGVRKEKSRLAGGIELFTLSEITIHRSARSDLALLTSARMKTFYQNILSDLNRLNLASKIIKEISRITDQIDSPEFFSSLKQVLEGLNNGYQLELIEAWFNFNLTRIKGEQINLLTDISGTPLTKDTHYVWAPTDAALAPLDSGSITSDEIKLMRLILVSPLALVAKVKNLDKLLEPVLSLSRQLAF